MGGKWEFEYWRLQVRDIISQYKLIMDIIYVDNGTSTKYLLGVGCMKTPWNCMPSHSLLQHWEWNLSSLICKNNNINMTSSIAAQMHNTRGKHGIPHIVWFWWWNCQIITANDLSTWKANTWNSGRRQRYIIISSLLLLSL